LPDLKNTTDDALPNYLKSIGFIQSHVLTDIRLGLGYLAVLLSAATFYLDYTTTWSENKTVTLYAVIVYFTLNSALTLWIWGIEKGKIYTGSKEETLVGQCPRGRGFITKQRAEGFIRSTCLEACAQIQLDGSV